jgi:flavin-dependent dehydrogenase
MAELDLLDVRPRSWSMFPSTALSGPAQRAFTVPWPKQRLDGTAIPRIDFDAALIERAIAAGAHFVPATTVTAVDDRTLTLRARSGATKHFDADIIALAEGATGGLAAMLGFPPHHERIAAFRGYAPPIRDLDPAYQIHYDAHLLPGYAWIFPVERRRANVGIMVLNRSDVRARLRAWLDGSAVAQRWFGKLAQLEDAHGGIIPAGRSQRVHGRIFALGDSAGIADPLSGEGISQALSSGRLLAEALLAAAGDPRRAAAPYERSMLTFDANNREARRMRTLMTIFAQPFFQLAEHRPRFAEYIVDAGYFPKTNLSWFPQAMLALR